MSSNPNFAFFGTSELSVKILDKLIENGYVPSLVVTAPDKPKGRKMIMTPPPVKVFAQAHNLKIAQPHSLSAYNLPARHRKNESAQALRAWQPNP